MRFKTCTDKSGDPYHLIFVDGEQLGAIEKFDEYYVFVCDRGVSLSLEELKNIVWYMEKLS